VEKFGKKMWKKIGVEKTWISVEKCQRGKKRDKFPWKNITYLVVVPLWHTSGVASRKLGAYATDLQFCRCWWIFQRTDTRFGICRKMHCWVEH
jgi:hypothetical protein